jgi:hypothetical protein
MTATTNQATHAETTHAEAIQAAQERIAQDRAERERQCLAEIIAVLGTYGCEMRAVLQIENGSIEQRIRVVSLS